MEKLRQNIGFIRFLAVSIYPYGLRCLGLKKKHWFGFTQNLLNLKKCILTQMQSQNQLLFYNSFLFKKKKIFVEIYWI